MQEPIAKHFHVGLIHPMAYPQIIQGEGPVLETLGKILADEYFAAVEVTWIEDPRVRARAAKMLKTAHMDVIFAGQPPLLLQKLDLNSPDDAAKQRAVEQCKRSVDQAYELGASILAVLSGPDPGSDDRDNASRRLVDSLCQTCTYANSQANGKPLVVSLETFDQTIDKKCLIGPTEDAAAVAREVRSECPNFGLTVDLSHQPLLGESIDHMIIKAAEYLVHAHIGNCVIRDTSHPAYGDAHPAFGVDGGENGVEQVTEFLSCLTDVGFFKKDVPTEMPVVSFEVKPMEGEDADIIVAGAKRVLNEAWARL